MKKTDNSLQTFIVKNTIPLYAHFEKAHQEERVQSIIKQSLYLAELYDVDVNMVYAIAACHDLGLQKYRRTYHLVSEQIIKTDKQQRNWFSTEQIEIMIQAVEDHRASSDHEPRSLYGEIIAETDRLYALQQTIKDCVKIRQLVERIWDEKHKSS